MSIQVRSTEKNLYKQYIMYLSFLGGHSGARTENNTSFFRSSVKNKAAYKPLYFYDNFSLMFLIKNFLGHVWDTTAKTSTFLMIFMRFVLVFEYLISLRVPDRPPKAHNPNLYITKRFVALVIGL